MTMRLFILLFRDKRGVAAAEMALIIPLLTVLMLGSFETGHFFWNQHKVVKSVRDAARYAGRQKFSAYSCSDVTDTLLKPKIINLARTGQISGGKTNVMGWIAADVTVRVSCDPSTTTGIYKGEIGGAKRVRVIAVVTYPSLFNSLGVIDSSFKVSAQAQAAVMGI